MREVGKPIAGKTGTTNDEKDAWFVGFSPDIAVGVYIGYDKPRHLGRGVAGGNLSAPIVRDFMKVALADKPAVPFRVPAGIKLIRIDPRTGMRVSPGSGGRAILEAFKPGTSPPDNYAVIGVADADGRPMTVPPDAERAVRSGTGGSVLTVCLPVRGFGAGCARCALSLDTAATLSSVPETAMRAEIENLSKRSSSRSGC